MRVIFSVNRAMKSQLNKKIKDDRGFTLVELILVVMLIFAIVSIVSATYLLSVNTSRDVIEITTSAIDSRVVMYRISKDLRETIDINSAESNNIIFRTNVDDDSDYELLNYYLLYENGYYNLYRKVDNENAQMVAGKIIDSNIFNYYSGINTPEEGYSSVSEEELDNIKIVEIKLKIDQSGEESQKTMKLETAVYLRNKT